MHVPAKTTAESLRSNNALKIPHKRWSMHGGQPSSLRGGQLVLHHASATSARSSCSCSCCAGLCGGCSRFVMISYLCKEGGGAELWMHPMSQSPLAAYALHAAPGAAEASHASCDVSHPTRAPCKQRPRLTGGRQWGRLRPGCRHPARTCGQRAGKPGRWAARCRGTRSGGQAGECSVRGAARQAQQAVPHPRRWYSATAAAFAWKTVSMRRATPQRRPISSSSCIRNLPTPLPCSAARGVGRGGGGAGAPLDRPLWRAAHHVPTSRRMVTARQRLQRLQRQQHGGEGALAGPPAQPSSGAAARCPGVAAPRARLRALPARQLAAHLRRLRHLDFVAVQHGLALLLLKPVV